MKAKHELEGMKSEDEMAQVHGTLLRSLNCIMVMLSICDVSCFFSLKDEMTEET